MLIAQNRRTMTYKEDDYYVDIVTRDKMDEAWIYKETPNECSPKFYMIGVNQRFQDYFTFYEMVCEKLDDYKWLCDADVSFSEPDEKTERDWEDYCEFQLSRQELANQVAWREVMEGVTP